MVLFLSRDPKNKLLTYSLLTILATLIFAIIIQRDLLYKYQGNLNYKITTLLANDIANRMQINHSEYIKGHSSFYVQPYNMQQQNIINQHVDLSCDIDPKGCKPYVLAANDLISWQQTIQENLTNGYGTVTFDPSLENYSINITWQDPPNNKKKSFKLDVATINQPWQHICDLTTKQLSAEDLKNQQQKIQIIYDSIMKNKHNYNNFVFNATLFTNYLNKINNFDIKLANRLCDITCQEYHYLNTIDNNLCDCKLPMNYRAVNFNCDNNV